MEIIKLGILASVFLTVFTFGLAASWDDVRYLWSKPALLLRSLASMFVIMPAICVGVALLTHLPTAIKVALVVVAISPVAVLLPMKVLVVGGHRAFVISLAALAAVCSVVLVPVVSSLLAQWFNNPLEVPLAKVVSMLLTTILIPLLLGIEVHRRMPVFAAKVQRPAELVGILLLVSCAVPLLVRVWPLLASFFGNGTVIILALIALLGTAVGHFLGGPDAWHRKVLALTTPTRHPGVAIVVATSAYPEGKLALGAVLLFWLIVQLATIPYILWSKRAAGQLPSSATPGSSR